MHSPNKRAQTAAERRHAARIAGMPCQVCKALHQGKKKGPTAWVRKALAEREKGKRVVLVYPVDKWILMLLAAGAKVENLGDVKWLATEDRSQGKGTGRHIACFVLEPHNVAGKAPAAPADGRP